MRSNASIEHVASNLLGNIDWTLVNCKVLQTLWAGYGHICTIEATPSQDSTEKNLSLILKYVSPPVSSGRRQDEGHLRKVISYQVEQYFYTHLAPLMPKEIAIASCLSSVDAHDSTGNITAMILTDLRDEFPVAGESQGELNQQQVDAAIDWLARFHGFWWARSQTFQQRDTLRRPPLEEARRNLGGSGNTAALDQTGVWLNGGYTYLATRQSEFAQLSADSASEWSSKLCVPTQPGEETIAHRVARFLSPSPDHTTAAITPFETLIHGDVKSENLFTTTTGDAVAFFDFQYVGLGLGVCDIAKLFTCSLPEHLLSEGACDGLMHADEERLLRRYLDRIERVSGKKYDWEVFVRHWETALVDWLRFQASWGFWGNTDWLEARVGMILGNDDGWRSWLSCVVDGDGDSDCDCGRGRVSRFEG